MMLLVFSSTKLVAQSSNDTQQNNISTTEKVMFPIKAKGNTDPNYEKNLTKSNAYVPYIRKEHSEPIKNESYYKNLIQELKTEINERKKTTNPNDEIAIGKITRIKYGLFLAEENLKKITQEN